MTDEQRKHKRKVYGLRYRMKKKGYHFAGRENCCTIPDDDSNRSPLMEKRSRALGFNIQYSLMPLFTKMGGVGSLLSVLCVVVSLCENAVTNL